MTVKLTSKAFLGTLLVMQSAYCRAFPQNIDIYGYLLQISVSADTKFHSALTKFLLRHSKWFSWNLAWFNAVNQFKRISCFPFFFFLCIRSIMYLFLIRILCFNVTDLFSALLILIIKWHINFLNIKNNFKLFNM